MEKFSKEELLNILDEISKALSSYFDGDNLKIECNVNKSLNTVKKNFTEYYK